MNNPYVVDRPLTDQDLFHGRDASSARLNRHLSTGHRLFVLCGRRYVGKTSFVNHLATRLSARYRVQRFVVQQQTPGATPEPLWTLMSSLAAGLGQPPPEAGSLAADREGYLSRYLGAMRPSLAEPSIVDLWCLDGVPPALVASRDWNPSLATLHMVLRRIDGLAILLVVEGPVGHVKPDPGTVDIPILTLDALREEDTEAILAGPVRGQLSYDYEVIRRIHRLTGGNPFFVQVFGRLLFEQRIGAGWVGLPDVDHAMDRVVALGAPIFEDIWGSSSPRNRVVLCAFADMMGHHGIGSAREIAYQLGQQSVQMPLAAIEASLAELAQLEVLDRLGAQTYRFNSEISRTWLKKNKSLMDAVRQARGDRQIQVRPTITQRRSIDWPSVALWMVAGALAVLIALAWRSRQRGIVWTAEPTPIPTVDPGLAPTLTPLLPTPDTGLIAGSLVYTARQKEQDTWQIFKMHSDGSDPARVTKDQSNNTSPIWSPDGRKILFSSDRDGNREVYVMNADGNEQLNLSANAAEDWTPSWSPDGKRIAFASLRDGNWEIYVMEANGSKQQRITQNRAAEFNPVWSPDGRSMAFVSDRDDNLEIYVMNADGTNQRRLTQNPATDQAPAWSPDGTRIAWESYRDGNMEIYVANADGTAVRNLTQDSRSDDHGPTWSPNGRRIAFFSNREQGWDIYSLDIETGERRNLTMSPLLEQWPHWGR